MGVNTVNWMACSPFLHGESRTDRSVYLLIRFLVDVVDQEYQSQDDSNLVFHVTASRDAIHVTSLSCVTARVTRGHFSVQIHVAVDQKNYIMAVCLSSFVHDLLYAVQA